MDIEQLKLILEMVGAAGDGAKDLALLWFVLAFLQSAVGYAIWTALLVMAYRVVMMLIDHLSFGNEIVCALGSYPPLDRRDKKQVIAAIKAWTASGGK